MRYFLCWLGLHRPHIPTGSQSFDPITCTRCAAVLDISRGGWCRP